MKIKIYEQQLTKLLQILNEQVDDKKSQVLVVGDTTSSLENKSWNYLLNEFHPDWEITTIAQRGATMNWVINEVNAALKEKKFDKTFLFLGFDDVLNSEGINNVLQKLQELIDILKNNGGVLYLIQGFDYQELNPEKIKKTKDCDLSCIKKKLLRLIDFQNKLSSIKNVILIPIISDETNWHDDNFLPKINHHIILSNIIDQYSSDSKLSKQKNRVTYDYTPASGNFIDVTKKIINEFEGGYWNPSCSNFSGSKHPSKSGIYSNSTETMFGLDRYNGNIESIPSGKLFFELIDQEKEDMGAEQINQKEWKNLDNFCKKWKWNYKGGELQDKLTNLAALTMEKFYNDNVKSYLNDETKKVIESNRGLLLHFSYATWNGMGYFKKFAKSMNDAVKEGKPMDELLKIAKKDREKIFGGTSWGSTVSKINAAIDSESQLS